MAYTNVKYIGAMGYEIKGKEIDATSTETSLFIDIAVSSFSVDDDYTLLPIDYKNASNTWDRYLLNVKRTTDYSFHGGTISFTFLSKLKTKQPIFYIKQAIQYWVKLYPTTGTSDLLQSVEYRGAIVEQAEMEKVDIGGKKLLQGRLVMRYKFKKNGSLT